MLEAMRLNPPSRLENADSAQMRIFGGDATEIIPHGGDNPLDLGLGKLGESAAEVAPGKFGNTEKRPNAARQRTTEGGGAIERQCLEHREQRRRAPGLQTIAEPGHASSHGKPGSTRRRVPPAQRAQQGPPDS